MMIERLTLTAIFRILIKKYIFKHILIYFLIKYLFLMSKKCVSEHPRPVVTLLSPLLGHYNIFMMLIRPIVVLMPIKMYLILSDYCVKLFWETIAFPSPGPLVATSLIFTLSVLC